MMRLKSVVAIVFVWTVCNGLLNSANAQKANTDGTRANAKGPTADIEVYNLNFKRILIMALDIDDPANPALLDKYIDDGDHVPQTFHLSVPVKKDIALVAVFTGVKDGIGVATKKLVDGDDYVVYVKAHEVTFVDKEFVKFLMSREKK